MKTKITVFALLCLFLGSCHNMPGMDRPVNPEISGSTQSRPAMGLPWRVMKGSRIATLSPGRTPRIFLQKKAL